jgi:hypothetical protein
VNSSSIDPKRKLQAAKLEAALAALDAARSLVVAQLDELETHPVDDALLDAKQSQAKYGLGHEGLRGGAERGELAVQRGARGKLLVLESELRRYIASRPYKPTPRRALPSANLDQWEAEADRSLRVVGGRK